MCLYCDKPNIGRNLCSMHYYRWYRNGDPLKRKNNIIDKEITRKEYDRDRRQKIKDIVIKYYSNGTYKCYNCGLKFALGNLTIYHINHDGKDDRIKHGYGSTFYKWLIDQNFPNGLSCACWDCNLMLH